ncbi:DEAD/DEAH box helicase [Natronoflexus pectinivorans]|uniref:RAD3-like DEAD/DEAH box helicase n=1 Tax=Natronoflexus pectinivorans TaxID=682526 RepID=A0A4R2G1R8_9BACT|nr:DEAD/DEAH box helicase [Natronoflexus pectinivorans]TCO01480.1 RAD3-like DEAD/DEAH box helicase [Natronoflexus pectinivorans]
MDSKEKRTLKYIGKISEFNAVVGKLITNQELNDSEKSYLLGVSILLIKHYQIDRRFTSYIDFAYYLILKYSLNTGDYKPLYDISVNLGFYPIANDIIKYELLPIEHFDDSIIYNSISKFRNESNYIETLEQNHRTSDFLHDESFEKCYLAPTSFGKSNLIISSIKNLEKANHKIVIVLPTKSLLMQTYQLVRSANLGRKIIMHDEMYDDEEEFIAVFTQERALRLMNRKNIAYDVLFIDEAHNILNDDSRSILLSRLISKNRKINNNQRVIYLSPLIENIHNVRVSEDQHISTHTIEYNLKEPDLFELKLNGLVRLYNRFLDEFYSLGKNNNPFQYTIAQSNNKNFIYNYRPVRIEEFAKEFCNYLPEIEITDAIAELKKILRKEVHKDFYVVDCLNFGVIYIHGKLPDLIKEYLEEKYRTLSELKYIIANSVILEGMNLPIDCLFVYNTTGLKGKELINLIGRVNRLNQIFNTEENLQKLVPPIHFINTEYYNRKSSNMENKIKELRSRSFKDEVENPILTEFDFEKQAKKTDPNYLLKVKIIQENEDFISANHASEQDKLKSYIIESGISNHYSDINELIQSIELKIRRLKLNEILGEDVNFNEFTMLEKLHYMFVKDINSLIDFEIGRLNNKEARDYYENFILIGRKKSLQENIISQFEFFKKKSQSTNPKMYFGSSYGEIDFDDLGYNKTYIDLRVKDDSQLINLAVVKLKMEEDFVSFKLNKFIVMLFDYKLIDLDEYNLYIYGTTDEQKIALTKYGLNISLISRLSEDGQLSNMSFDSYNNLTANENFYKFLDSVDDFYKFEIKRFLN